MQVSQCFTTSQYFPLWVTYLLIGALLFVIWPINVESCKDDVNLSSLRHCLKGGVLFLSRYLRTVSKFRSSQNAIVCSNFTQFEECIKPYINNRCHHRTRNLGALRHHWLPIVQHFQCICNTDVASLDLSQCDSELRQCFEWELGGPLAKGCNLMFSFNSKQNTHSSCFFKREAFQCQRMLLTSACGQKAGQLLHNIAYIDLHQRMSNCSASDRDLSYYYHSGFHYSHDCPPTLVDDVNQCVLEHFATTMLLFYEDNDLIAIGNRSDVSNACRDYRLYKECVSTIELSCPQGATLVQHYEDRLRRYRLKMDYICGKEEKDYTLHLACFQSLVINETMVLCNPIWKSVKTQLDEMTAVTFFCSPQDHSTQLVLSELEQLQLCYADIYEKRCGKIASRVMSGLIQLAFFDPFYLRFDYKPDCQLHLPNLSNKQFLVENAQDEISTTTPNHLHTEVNIFIDVAIEQNEQSADSDSKMNKIEQDIFLHTVQSGQQISVADCRQPLIALLGVYVILLLILC